MDKLADKIAETGLFSAERTEMIARTEINMAQNAGMVEAARQAAAAGRRIKIVSTRLPEDFGTKDYGLRRAEAISKHLSTVMCEPQNFPRLFQLWLSPSANLRNYLWAHRNEYIQVAQELVNVLPGAAVIDILRYLRRSFLGAQAVAQSISLPQQRVLFRGGEDRTQQAGTEQGTLDL